MTNPKQQLDQSVITIADRGAPIIFVDEAPVCGHYNGIFHFSLAVGRHGKVEGKVVAGFEMVAHLRMNRQALDSLKAAIASAELIAQPTPSKN